MTFIYRFTVFCIRFHQFRCHERIYLMYSARHLQLLFSSPFQCIFQKSIDHLTILWQIAEQMHISSTFFIKRRHFHTRDHMHAKFSAKLHSFIHTCHCIMVCDCNILKADHCSVFYHLCNRSGCI